MHRYVFIHSSACFCIFASMPFVSSVPFDIHSGQCILTSIGLILSLVASIRFFPVNQNTITTKSVERPESPNTLILRKRIQAMNWRVLLNKANALSVIQEAIQRKQSSKSF